jgi:hypothetical protein
MYVVESGVSSISTLAGGCFLKPFEYFWGRMLGFSLVVLIDAFKVIPTF